jgi:hypothetical protein
LVEGAPSVALGVVIFVLMPSSIATARFLTPGEREALAAAVALDHSPGPLAGNLRGAAQLLRNTVRNGYLWVAFVTATLTSLASHTYLLCVAAVRPGFGLCAAVHACLPARSGGPWAVGLPWCFPRANRCVCLPRACRTSPPPPPSRPPRLPPRYTPIIINNLLNGTALSNSASVAATKEGGGLKAVGLSVVPYTLAVVSAISVAHSVQKRDEHFLHVSCCLLLAGAILALFPALAAAHAAAGFLSLALSLAVGAGVNGPAMALVGRLCKGPEQVVAMPLFSSFSVLGGIVGPFIVNALMATRVRALFWDAGATRGEQGQAVGGGGLSMFRPSMVLARCIPIVAGVAPRVWARASAEAAMPPLGPSPPP